jgi:hypothetical protein
MYCVKRSTNSMQTHAISLHVVYAIELHLSSRPIQRNKLRDKDMGF